MNKNLELKKKLSQGSTMKKCLRSKVAHDKKLTKQIPVIAFVSHKPRVYCWLLNPNSAVQSLGVIKTRIIFTKYFTYKRFPKVL